MVNFDFKGYDFHKKGEKLKPKLHEGYKEYYNRLKYVSILRKRTKKKFYNIKDGMDFEEKGGDNG